jgi:hypothetical protein
MPVAVGGTGGLSRQHPVELIQNEIGQQMGKGPPLRGPFIQSRTSSGPSGTHSRPPRVSPTAFTSIRLVRGLPPPSCWTCLAHMKKPPSTIATDKILTIGRSRDSFSARAELQSTSMRPSQAQKIIGQAARLIRTARLNASLRLHLQPINVLVSNEPLGRLPCGRSSLGVGFALRCFQRLSLPHVATQRCPWQDNWYTRGASVPVLSY